MTLGPETLDDSIRRRLDHRLATEQSRQRLPSVVAGLVREHDLVWTGAAGTLDARAAGEAPSDDTQYRLGSITKTFVAVAVMRLRDEGLIDLGQPLSTHLDELIGPVGQVTISQLLTHTSGLQAETHGPWWERTEGAPWSDLAASGLTLRHAPGTTHHYSNVGYGVLGELVARLRGRPWPAVVEAEILRPLGMTRTSTRPVAPAAPGLAVHPFADLVHVEPEHDAVSMGPAGQLWSTVTDMRAWASFVAGRTLDVLSAETHAEMLRPAAVNDVPRAPWTVAHGLGWQIWNVDGRRSAGHGGSMPGFLANLRVDLESGDGCVAMTNATSGLGPVATDLLDLVREHRPRSPRPWTADASQSPLLDLVGPWFWGPMGFTVALDPDGGFRLGEPGTGRGSRFRPDGPDGSAYVGLDGYHRGEPLVIERSPEGTPTRLVLASFVFTRTPYAPDQDVPGGVQGTWG